MRIVLATNVVLCALLWRGTPHRLLGSVRSHEWVLIFTSTILLEERAEVLLRPVPAKRLARIGRTARKVLADEIGVAELVAPMSTPPVVRADPDDDHVIAAAVAADADRIVSGDRHLLALGIQIGIKIVTPANAIIILTS